MCSGGPSWTRDSWVALRARVRGGSAKIIVDRLGYTADSGSVDRATKKLTDMTQEACLLVWLRERYKQIYSYPFKLSPPIENDAPMICGDRDFLTNRNCLLRRLTALGISSPS